MSEICVVSGRNEHLAEQRIGYENLRKPMKLKGQIHQNCHVVFSY